MEDEILDSALDAFDEETKETPQKKPESVQEILEDLKNNENEPKNMEDIEKLFKGLTDEIEGNEELRTGLEQLGTEFFQEGALEESMTELRDKLKSYIETHELEASEKQRYEAQLAGYTEICENLKNGKETEAMDLVAKLATYGDLPEELLPPMPEDCAVM